MEDDYLVNGNCDGLWNNVTLELGDCYTVTNIYDEESLWQNFMRWLGVRKVPRRLKYFRVTAKFTGHNVDYERFPFPFQCPKSSVASVEGESE